MCWVGIHVIADEYPCLVNCAIPAYVLGMPNSSGGAVVISSRRLIGVHVGSCWHRDTRATCGRSEGGSNTSEGGSSTSTEPPDILEVDASKMWREPDDGQDEPPDHVAAQESYANIPVSDAWGSTRRGAGSLRLRTCIWHIFRIWMRFRTQSWPPYFPFASTAQIPTGYIRHCSGSCFHPEEPEGALSGPTG